MPSHPREKIDRLGGKFLFYLETYVLPFEYLLRRLVEYIHKKSR
jgi:hypothetical protein